MKTATTTPTNTRAKALEERKAIKSKYDADVIVLARVDDFYETYETDAYVTSALLGINIAKAGDTKMACFPHRGLDAYLPKFIRAGFRVAII